ncbi:short transient receptor potential channel 5-like [Pocillopora damicornis]|uniref:short transient receptor potential channel 5-like n=1 Tax=Pocillopora damicornis TaxID=46731 RepID=UPI000F54E9F8|nr:short transient receptor potential channel 5-like [Pocillopora damicornis]
MGRLRINQRFGYGTAQTWIRNDSTLGTNRLHLDTKRLGTKRPRFISHRLVYRLFKIRWKRGLPSKYRQGMKARLTVISFTILETILTPILLPLIAYFSYKDQTCLERKMLRDLYLNYLRTPFVISIKDRLSQVVHLGLHFRLCVLASSVSVRTEEWLTLIFYIGFMLSEYQQYRSSKSAKEKRVRVYLRNMWNYVDMVILGLFFMMLVLRCFTLNETDPYQSRLLQVVNILYGISTLLLTLRFSSILEVNKTVGPLQLALFRMCIDLLIILTQFSFVIMAFSAAITKVYVAEISFLTPAHQRESNETGRLEELNETGRTGGFCTKGKSACLLQTSKYLIWSVFGLTELDTMETNDDGSDYVVGILFVSFLIISVVMLVNILIALLTNTYNKVETNADLEWKFFRAVVAEEYRRYHPIVVPFNIISLPMSFLYTKKYGDNRAKRVKERQRRHEERCRLELFPALTRRYLDKHGGSFPLSNEEKIDLVADKFDQLANKIDVLANKIEQQEQKLDRLLEVMEKYIKLNRLL